VKNSTETDKDCGGICGSTCKNGEVCLVDNDCKSKTCFDGVNFVCAASCFDGIQNLNETDIDCGGGCAAKCTNRQVCAINADCAAGLSCQATVCRPTHCVNATFDPVVETAEDCGGLCGGCIAGDACLLDADCKSGSCVTLVCQ